MAATNANARKFVLVIDAGHGGKDTGAPGAYSLEKNINLNVALEFGRLVKQHCPDVKVIYTRKTDVFIPLQTRADIANNAKADLFISVHTNSVKGNSSARGSETYSLGMARAAANLEVAKRENNVIVLEKNYKKKYEGFDPNKAESYVIFEFMQDKHMKQSVELARCIQKEYTRNGRHNRGVHQAGFLVLRKTSMPAVLTELGFITNSAEERFMNTPQGVRALALSIYNGFLRYRREYDYRKAQIPPEIPIAQEQPEDSIKKIQDFAFNKTNENKADSAIADTSLIADNQTIEKQTSENPENSLTDSVPEDKKKTNVPDINQKEKQYCIQFATSSRKINIEKSKYRKILRYGVTHYHEQGLYKYIAGSYGQRADALEPLQEIKKIAPDAFIVVFKEGTRIR